MRKTKLSVHQPSLEVLRQLLPELAANIKGQPEVLERLAKAVLRGELHPIPQRGCRGAFLFAGRTGVGKTEAAQVLARHLFGEHRFVRFDCCKFTSRILLGSEAR